MMYAELALWVIAILYVGQVFGLIFQCESNRFLKPIWQYSFTVPFVLLLLCVAFLQDSIKSGNAKLFLSFFAIPQKSTIIMGCYAKIHQSRKETVPQKKVPAPSVRYTVKFAKPILVEAVG